MISLNALKTLIENELSVDRTFDDVTTRLLGADSRQRCRVTISAKEKGVFCGEAVLQAFEFENLESRRDGNIFERGEVLASFNCTVGDALTQERTLLNLLTHLSGVATATRRFVDAVKPFPTKILATRKTLPGLRDLQLHAVEMGGGLIHRRSLSDGILIKDNHIQISGVETLLKRCNDRRSPLHRVEIEVQSFEQLEEALKLGADVIMLDNFDLAGIAKGVQRIREVTEGRTKVEVSGNVALENARSIAELGVDYISVGAITHSVKTLNMSLDLALVP